MVNQISLHHSFTISILKYWLSKNFGCLQSRRCRQPNFNRIEIIDNRPIFALVLCLITVQQLLCIHVAVKNIPSMRLIYNNQIIIGNGRHSFSIIKKNPLYHSLHRSHLNTGFFLDVFFFQTLDIINIIKRHQIFQFHFFKNV